MEQLIAAGVHVRLVKGAYVEPASRALAYGEPKQVHTAQTRILSIGARIAHLATDPAITALPDPDRYLGAAHSSWTITHIKATLHAQHAAAKTAATKAAAAEARRKTNARASWGYHQRQQHHHPSELRTRPRPTPLRPQPRPLTGHPGPTITRPVPSGERYPR